MIGRNIDSVKPVSIAEVRELLEAEKETRELSFEQQMTLDYAQKVSKTSAKAAKAMEKELIKIEKLTPEVATKLIDMLPANKEQLTAIVSKERYTLTDKEATQILGILKKGADKPPTPKKAEKPAEEEAEKEETS